MLWPFLPGEYDPAAASLSIVAQGIAWAGLLLAPLGLIWLAYEFRNRSKRSGAASGKDAGYWLAMASIGAATTIPLGVAVGAFLNGGIALGIGTVAAWTYCVVKLLAKVRARRTAEMRSFNTAPLYVVVVPLMAFIARIALLGPASEFSRNRAIENSSDLIRDIEGYRDRQGRYPPSLLSVHRDYKPSVVGVEQYHYEPNGDAYNVYFEQLSLVFGTQEFVMYNKLGEHEMTAHKMDLLELSPAEIRRGYHAVHAASRRHWKRFLFD